VRKNMRMNTEVLNRGGATRSSVEASVMGVERRGCVMLDCQSVNSKWRMS